jgi:tetratricopeptide (TPR) repeat protein
MVVRFPEFVELHLHLAEALYKVFSQTKDSDVLEKSLRHGLRAMELAPNDFNTVGLVATLLHSKGNHASALEHGKRALSLAPTRQDKITVLHNIANMYIDNHLYVEARCYLRDALKIDDCHAGVVEDIAGCFFLEGNKREAIRMAKRGLMLDPRRKICQQICDLCGCRD